MTALLLFQQEFPEELSLEVSLFDENKEVVVTGDTVKKTYTFAELGFTTPPDGGV